MNKEFEVHMLNDLGKMKAGQIAHAFDSLLDCLTDEPALCPPGRELALVKTKLEEACFFAKKAMASDSANTTQEHRIEIKIPDGVDPNEVLRKIYEILKEYTGK